MPSLVNTLRRCHSTVRALMKSCAPISGFDRPSRASRAICVFLRRELVACLDAALVHCCPGGQQLPPGALGEALHAHRVEHRRTRCSARRARPLGGSHGEATPRTADGCGRARRAPASGPDARWPRGRVARRRRLSLRSARERASMPSAQSVPLARAFPASRFRASLARSVLPVRAADSISSLKPQFSATTSSILAGASRRRRAPRRTGPAPLQRTACAYSQMATPMPSPRAPASRSVVSISRRASRSWPRHAARIKRAVRRCRDSRRLLYRSVPLRFAAAAADKLAAEHEHGNACS